jgi:splicing factor U2AF subunit
MAGRRARIIGTEEDKFNCPFYYKIGACRHGERCSRTHLRPNFSQTLIFPHLYCAPQPDPQTQQVPDDTEHFEEFYEEILDEFMKFGEIEEMHVVENLGDHMFGNVYVKYRFEEEAESCLKAMNGRYYAGRVIMTEFSPVTDFREARCRQFDEAECSRGGYCNFMHLKRVPRFLRKKMRKSKKKKKERARSRSESIDHERTFARSTSEERRATIAKWNRAKAKEDRRAAERKEKEPEPAPAQ